MLLFMIAALNTAPPPPSSLEARLAAVSGIYALELRSPAAPGCGIDRPINTAQHAEGKGGSLLRIKTLDNTFRLTFRSGHGSLFIFSGVPSLRGSNIVVHGRYKTMAAVDHKKPGVLGSGTFDFVVDAHDNAIIIAESLKSTTIPGCFVHGAVHVGVRLAPFDGKMW